MPTEGENEPHAFVRGRFTAQRSNGLNGVALSFDVYAKKGHDTNGPNGIDFHIESLSKGSDFVPQLKVVRVGDLNYVAVRRFQTAEFHYFEFDGHVGGDYTVDLHNVAAENGDSVPATESNFLNPVRNPEYNVNMNQLVLKNEMLGIGVEQPEATLDVDGLIKYKSYRTTAEDPCAEAPTGTMFYASFDGEFCFCNGSKSLKVAAPDTLCEFE